MKLPLRVVVAVLDALMKFHMRSQNFVWTLVLSQSLGFLYSDVSVFEYPHFTLLKFTTLTQRDDRG